MQMQMQTQIQTQTRMETGAWHCILEYMSLYMYSVRSESAGIEILRFQVKWN